MERTTRAWFGRAAALCAGAVPGLAAILAAEIGVGTRFADVVLEKLQPGRAYNIRELKGVPYEVRNAGDGTAEIQVEVLVPEKKELMPGYEPIPDPTWIRLVPERHKIPRQGIAFSDIIISIPDDPGLKGRHFQAGLHAVTIAGLFGSGVKSRLRFSVGPGPEALAAEKKRKAMVTLNFDIWPQVLYVANARAGEKYPAKKREGKAFICTNRSGDPLELVFRAVPWERRFTLPEETEPGLPEWLRFKERKVRIKPMGLQEAEFELEVPKGREGKKLAFLLSIELPSGTILSSGHRVFVTVAKE